MFAFRTTEFMVCCFVYMCVCVCVFVYLNACFVIARMLFAYVRFRLLNAAAIC